LSPAVERGLRGLVRTALAIVVAFLAATGCGDPCVDLSKKICRCEKSELLQQACLQRVEDSSSTLEATDEQNDRCSELMDGCTCTKLEDGDLAACGLTEPAE
jgi:hypothetical protein